MSKLTKAQKKQKDWAEYKTRQREDEKAIRAGGVAIIPLHTQGSQVHDCPHALKHHKQSGRCRKGCKCTWAADRADRKRRAQKAA